jgi:helicase MOV-10
VLRPGTGKTSTVVETIRQILDLNKNARILACAPSNAAADIIVDRLKELGPSQLFRMNAPSRLHTTVPKSVEPFCLKKDANFAIPVREELAKYKVIISTCISASIPFGIGMSRGHFDYIFIDEAGQACEPEVMVPIKTMAGLETNIVLSGDPQQLGPIIRSAVACELGLQTSYLDRLMARDIYEEMTGRGIS